MTVRPFLAGMIMGKQNLRWASKMIGFYEQKSSCQVDRIITSTRKHERVSTPTGGRLRVSRRCVWWEKVGKSSCTVRA